jgi:hypothetical protein
MAHAFKIIPATPAFGTLKEVIFQSEYLKNKKSKRSFCTSETKCGRVTKADSYNHMNLYRQGFRLNKLKSCNVLPFDKTNLIANLYSKMDMEYACSFTNGLPCVNPELTYASDSCGLVPPCCYDACKGSKTLTVGTNATNPFNFTNTIDPVGDLFGKTQCGTENFTHYMYFSPPTGATTLQNS